MPEPQTSLTHEAVESRLRRVRAAMVERDVDVLVLTTSPDLHYLLGLQVPFNQRLTAAVVTPTSDPVQLWTSALQAASFDGPGRQVNTWDSDPDAVVELARAVRSTRPRRVGIDEALGTTRVLALHDQLGAVSTLVSAQQTMADARQVKDHHEVELVAQAVQRLEDSWQLLCGTPLAGSTELDVSRRLREILLAQGMDSVAWTDVASGPNAAEALHHGDQRRIREGDALVVDLAGAYRGYHADICKTVSVGPPPDGLAEAYRQVRRALDLAVAAIRPGVSCHDVDAVARNALREPGGPWRFTHRLGHGIGLSAQEAPSLEPGSDSVLQAGQTLAVEPGLYLAGVWGVRLEDNVMVTPTGVVRWGRVEQELTEVT